jgi:hypothetical protein
MVGWLLGKLIQTSEPAALRLASLAPYQQGDNRKKESTEHDRDDDRVIYLQDAGHDAGDAI